MSLLTQTKRLYRSVNQRLVAGVLGGIAEFFHIDPVGVRLLYLFCAFTGSFNFSLALYALAWLVVPRATPAHD